MTPQDIGRAGQGDLAALRRLRNYSLDLATGEAVLPLVPRYEAVAQAELLAELAAGSGHAEDQVMLLVPYQVRVAALEHNKAACEDAAKEAVEANNIAGLDHWTRSVVELDERLRDYRAKIDDLLCAIFDRSDAEGPAILVNALSLQADRGDERAVPLLNFIMDSVTPERAAAIQAAVRAIEKEAAQ